MISAVIDRRYSSSATGAGLLAAFQDRVVQIGYVCLARIERHDHPLPFEIDFHIANSVYLHKRPTQFSYTFIAILALRRNFDRFQGRMITALGKEWTGRIRIVRSSWVHGIYFTRAGTSTVAPI